MSKRKEQESQLVDHIFVVNGEIVLEPCHRNILFELAFHYLFALVGQLLTVLHCHTLDDWLLEHAKARYRLRPHRVKHLWLLLGRLLDVCIGRRIEIRVIGIGLLLRKRIWLMIWLKLWCTIECGLLVELLIRKIGVWCSAECLLGRKWVGHKGVGSYWGAHRVHIAHALGFASRTS